LDQLDSLDLIRLLGAIGGTWFGAELLVRGSARLAIALGLRPLLVGLTVVAFGTSSPEAVVSFVAAMNRSAGMAVGNVVGSNIANVGLILGLVSLVHPMRVHWPDIRRDALFMGLSTIVASAAIYLGFTGWPIGILLLLTLLVSLSLAVRAPVAEEERSVAPVSRDTRTRVIAILQSVVGLALLILSARLLVGSAQDIARAFGIDEAIIGATMVAVGTSIPELAASIVAVVRGHYEIGIGNLVGSNLMNLSFVFGTVCLISPDATIPDDVANLLVPVMLAFTVLFVLMLRTGGRVRRREGAVLLSGYLVFSWMMYF
jgi:cation:H+ antiporter